MHCFCLLSISVEPNAALSFPVFKCCLLFLVQWNSWQDDFLHTSRNWCSSLIVLTGCLVPYLRNVSVYIQAEYWAIFSISVWHAYGVHSFSMYCISYRQYLPVFTLSWLHYGTSDIPFASQQLKPICSPAFPHHFQLIWNDMIWWCVM